MEKHLESLTLKTNEFIIHENECLNKIQENENSEIFRIVSHYVRTRFSAIQMGVTGAADFHNEYNMKEASVNALKSIIKKDEIQKLNEGIESENSQNKIDSIVNLAKLEIDYALEDVKLISKTQHHPKARDYIKSIDIKKLPSEEFFKKYREKLIHLTEEENDIISFPQQEICA